MAKKEKKQRQGNYELLVKPFFNKIEFWYRNGAIDETVAKALGVSRPCLVKYRQKYPEFAAICRFGKEDTDLQVQSSLYLNAMGYHYEEEIPLKLKQIVYDDKGRKTGEREFIQTVKVKKYKCGETLAQIYWMNNRKKNEWSQRVDQEQSNEELEKLDSIMTKIDEVANS